MDTRSFFSNKHLESALNILGIVLLVVAVFSHLWPKEPYLNIFFSSDALYLPSLYKDLITDGNGLKGWHLNPSPNFFPDMLFYFLLMAVTKSFIWSTFIFSIVQYLVIALLFSWIFRIIFPDRSKSYETFIFILLSFIALEFLYRSHDLGYTFLVLINSYHNGAFISALLCLVLTLKYLEKQKKMLLLFMLFIVFLGVLSDRLFIVLFPIPAIITFLLVLRKNTLRPLILITSVILSGVVLGLLCFNKIDNNTYEVFKPGQSFSLVSIADSFAVFYQHMGLILSSFGFKALTFYLFLVSLAPIFYVALRAYKQQQIRVLFCAGFSLIFSLCVIFSPIINGKYSDYACIRYNIFPVFFSGLNLMLFAAYVVKGRSLKLAGSIIVKGVALLIFVSALIKVEPKGLDGFFNYYPALVKQIDDLAEREHLQYGVGNYWVAKKVTLFSRKGVKMRSVFDDISIYDHVSNDAWFFNNIFTFVVLNNCNDTTLYRDKLEGIRAVRYDGELKLLKVNPFTYRKETGYRAINIAYKEK